MDMEFISIITWTVLVLFTIFGLLIECAEYCQLETFTARCNESEVILMQTARYGRMYADRCITGEETSLGCYGEVRKYIDEVCSGRSECTYAVSDLDKYVKDCYKNDRFRFLDATYSCISIQEDTNCSTEITNTDGYLKGPWISDISGTNQCPWKLSTKIGQQFRIDLIDISLGKALSDFKPRNKPCPINLQITDLIGDRKVQREKHLCYFNMSSERYITVYTSQGSEVHLHVSLDSVGAQNKDNTHYLLAYEAIGCPDYIAQPNTEMIREGNRLTVRCNQTSETWFLVCKDQEWFGFTGNCTETIATTVTQKEESNFPWGIVTAVAIGVAIGVFVGLAMLGVVLAVIRCREKNKQKPTSSSSDLSKIDVPYTLQPRSIYDTQPGTSSSYGTSRPAENKTYGQNHLERSSSYHASLHNANAPNITRSASYHYQTGPNRPLPSPHDPPYHIYGYDLRKGSDINEGKGKKLEKQNTLTTEADEHIYETAYMTRSQVLNTELEKEKRQKSLAKEYYEMRGTPQGTLEKQQMELTKY